MNGSARHPSHLEEAMRMEADAEVDALLDVARQEADDITAAAKSAARERLRSAIHAMRKERHARLGKAHARLNAARRNRQQAIQTALLDQAMAELAATLGRRWQDPQERTNWCLAIIEEARDRLEPGHWTIDHPADWAANADTTLADAFSRASGTSPSFNPDPEVAAGLRIRAGQSCLDGTMTGLLARRSRIEATLLGLLDETVTAEVDAP